MGWPRKPRANHRRWKNSCSSQNELLRMQLKAFTQTQDKASDVLQAKKALAKTQQFLIRAQHMSPAKKRGRPPVGTHEGGVDTHGSIDELRAALSTVHREKNELAADNLRLQEENKELTNKAASLEQALRRERAQNEAQAGQPVRQRSYARSGTPTANAIVIRKPYSSPCRR
mmetsp:Transcript_18736/g.43238  ORF Transcript_18736/g.43238 Transcript_18736/m.43238 type:complete len:172 (+) Transcript_18736:72-587(+)